jgi:hypothetical protein
MRFSHFPLGGTILLSLLVACTSSIAWGAELERSHCNNSAEQALSVNQFEAARQDFKSSLDATRRANDKVGEGVCSFYLGLTAQREAQAVGWSETSQAELLDQAIKWYLSSLDWQPQAPGTVSNLARAYIETKQPKKADALYQAVIGHANLGERVPLLQGYADLLAHQERWQESAKYYRDTLNLAGPEQPVNHQAWSSLLEIVLNHIPSHLEQEIWRAIEEGHQTVSAQSKAFEALSRKNKLPVKTRISLLKAIVAALAQQQYKPSEFAVSETGSRLYALRRDPVLGRAVRQVLALHAARSLTSLSSYDWWAALDSLDSKRSRLVVFRSLIRSLALKVGARETAQSYLKLGDRLKPKVPDPIIYGELATGYAALRRAAQLGDDLKRWEKLLALNSRNKIYGAPPLDPKDLATYHFKAAVALGEMRILSRSKSISVANHLQLATEQGEKAKEPALLFAIGAVQERLGMATQARETRDAARIIAEKICRELSDDLLGGVCSEREDHRDY